ncbi:UDP-glucose-4-epimerase, partial [Tulasnella sp. 403]
RVLVTGGAGYIGSHVVLTLLLTRRYKVISIDNHHNSYPEALKRVSEIARDELPEDASEQDRESAEVDAFIADLTKGEEVRGVFEKYGKDGIWGVIHVAAYKAVGESSEIPLAYYANNVSATVLLAQIMSEFGCTRMVYSSSATVYGTPPIIPIPETTPLKADSVYGRTKVMCETILQDLCHAEPDNWRVISLRYFNPAGAHPSGRIGEDPRGRPGNLLPLLSQMAIGRVKDTELKVFGNDFPTHDGTCVRDYLHVMDLASGHLLALDALESTSHAAFANLPDRAKYKASPSTTASTANDWVKISPTLDLSSSTTSTNINVEPAQEVTPAKKLTLNGTSLLVVAPTIPTEREILDPSTPAHLSPRAFDQAASKRKGPRSGLSTPTNLELEPNSHASADHAQGQEQRLLHRDDVFLEKKVEVS